MLKETITHVKYVLLLKKVINGVFIRQYYAHNLSINLLIELKSTQIPQRQQRKQIAVNPCDLWELCVFVSDAIEFYLALSAGINAFVWHNDWS